MTPIEELTVIFDNELVKLGGPADPDARAEVARGLAQLFEPVVSVGPLFAVRSASVPERAVDVAGVHGHGPGDVATGEILHDLEDALEGGVTHFHFEPDAAERAVLEECDAVELNLVAHVLSLARQVMPGDEADAKRHNFLTRAIARCGIENPTLRDLSSLSKAELERIVDQLRKLGEAFHRGTTWGTE